MNYRDEYKHLQREYYWTLPRALLAIAVTVFLATLILRPLIFASNILDPVNVVTTYERFHDLNAQFASRKAQIVGFKTLPPGDASNRIDLLAIQQSCRDIATKYNADNAKINRSLFKGHSLPETLNLGDCQ